MKARPCSETESEGLELSSSLLVSKTDSPTFTQFQEKAGPLEHWEPCCDGY